MKMEKEKSRGLEELAAMAPAVVDDAHKDTI